MAEAETDVYNAAGEYSGQCIGVDRSKDEQKSALVEFLRMKDVFVSLPSGIRSCTILLGLFGLYVWSSAIRRKPHNAIDCLD